MKRALLVLSVFLGICTHAEAQEKAYGIRAGLGAMSPGESNHLVLNAFYDVPMGHILFSPEIIVLMAESPEPAYGLNIKFRRYLGSAMEGEEARNRLHFIGDIGAQFVVWDTITTAGGPPKRAHVGIPVDLSAEIPTASAVQIEVTLSYTPMFFLGADAYYRSLFSALAGIRILVP